jgi:hypothetical protein
MTYSLVIALRILAALAVFVWVFLVALAAQAIDLVRDDNWWRFPLAVTLFVADVGALVVGVLALGAYAAGAIP